jgi:radical SAM protein with 4Fe4S-binding SPASM domain
MSNLAQLVLTRKRDVNQEYTLHLFEKCNLTCGFCWQDHTAAIGIDTVVEKAAIACGMVDKDSHPAFTFNIMGGEIFDDSIFNDKLTQDYIELVKIIHAHVVAKGKRAHFNLVTNLVTEQPDRVESMINTMRDFGASVELCTSYDAKGRFNKQQLALFKQNVERLRPYITCVSMLLTKPVINNLVADRDEYFKYLYEQGFYIYFDYYSPAEDHMVMAPSDKDLLRAFYYLVDNYPNVHPIKEWINNTNNYMSCRTSQLILPDGTTCTCGNLVADNSHVITFFKAPISRNDNDAIEDSFINQWNCIECEYFNRCTLGCFTQHAFAKRGQMKECPFKLTFDKIVYNKVVDVGEVSTSFGTPHTDLS